MVETTWLDYIMMALIVLTALLGLSRGVYRELVSCLIWIAAFIGTFLFYPFLASKLSSFFTAPYLQTYGAIIITFVAILWIGTLISFFLVGVSSGLSMGLWQRLLGATLGAARGLLIAASLLFIGYVCHVNNQEGWQNSRFVPYFVKSFHWVDEFFKRNSLHSSNNKF